MHQGHQQCGQSSRESFVTRRVIQALVKRRLDIAKGTQLRVLALVRLCTSVLTYGCIEQIEVGGVDDDSHNQSSLFLREVLIPTFIIFFALYY